MTDPLREDRSFTELIGELTRETTTLFRQEVSLAKAEVAQKVSRAGNGVAELLVGALILMLAFEGLLAAAVIGLAPVVGWWQSALIIGVAVLLVGAAVTIRGLANLRAKTLAPERTLASLRENRQWARERFR